VDTTLSEQVQATLDVLEMARKAARQVAQTMKKQRVTFGHDSGHMEDDIAHIIGKIRYINLLAERKEQIEVEAAMSDATDHGTTTD
jgi:hypothetical protein